MPETQISPEKEIAAITQRIAGIATELKSDQDIYDAGLSSIASLSLLLELEDAFGVSISDERFIACRTVAELGRMIAELQS